MATDQVIPPPPEGFELEGNSVPPPPAGFEIEPTQSSTPPPPPEGFELEGNPAAESPSWIQDKISRVAEGASSGTLNSIGGLARLADSSGNNVVGALKYAPGNIVSAALAKTGVFKSIADSAEEWAKSNTEQYQQGNAITPGQTPDSEGVEGYAQGLAGAAGQFAPQLLAGGAGVVPSTLSNVGNMFQQEYSAAKEKGASEETAVEAGLLNMPAAALDVLADRFALGKLLPNGFVGGKARQIAGRIAASVLTEGATEVDQDLYSNTLAKELGYDTNRKEDYLKTMVIGGILGGLVSGTEQVLTHRIEPKALETAQQVGPATTQAVVTSALDQPQAPLTIDSTSENQPISTQPEATPSDFENSLASEDLAGAESLLLNPSEAFQTPADLLAATQDDPLNEQQTQNVEAPVLDQWNGTDSPNIEALGNAEQLPGIEADAEANQELSPDGLPVAPPLFLSLNEEHRPVIDEWTPQLAASGITQDRVVMRDDIVNPVRVNWDSEGNPIMEVNAKEAARLTPDELGTLFNEEVGHVETVNAIRDVWDKSNSFDQHINNEMGKVVSEARSLGLNVESREIYGHESYSEGFEIIRQLIQGRNEGTVSEAVIRPDEAPTIFALLERMLAKFRTLLARKPDSTLANYVKNIEIALYGASDIGASQGDIPAVTPPGAVPSTPYQPNAPPESVSNYFVQPAGSPPINEKPSSYTEYQGKQFPVYSADKIKKSKGAFGDNYFYAPNTQSLWSSSADGFLNQFPSTPDGMRQANNLINDPSSPMDEATKNFVRSQMQVRLIEMAKSSNIIDRQQAYSLLDAIGSAQLQSGTSEAQALASRAGSNKQLQPYSGWLAGRNILVERQGKAVDPNFAENPEIKVRQIAQDAGTQAATELSEEMEKPDSAPKKDLERLVGVDILRLFNQINRAEGISWRDIFRNLPVGAQRERQAYLVKTISEHPQLKDLSEKDQAKVNQAIQIIWAKQRQRVFRDNLNREGAIGEKTKADREKVIQSAPKLLQYLNTGNLSTADFRDILSEHYGIAQLNGESMAKLRELAEQAYNSPEGVIRNKLLDQINRELFNIQGIRPFDVLKNVWFAGVLSSPRTWINIMQGGITIGAYNNMIQALDSGIISFDGAKRQRGYRVLSAFWGNMLESFQNAKDIALTGDYSRLTESQRHFQNILDGTATPDMLETIKASTEFSKNPALWLAGQASYVRRVMTAMDYLTQLSTREANILYIASLVDPEMYAAAEAKYNKEFSARAKEQAQNELGPKAKKVDIQARAREIMEEGIDEDIKERATEMARIAALNQDPKGLGGVVQGAIARLPFAIRAPLGLAFSRPMLNFIQIAANATPVIGTLNYYRAHPVVTKWVDGIFPGAKSGKRSETAQWLAPELPPEQMRVMMYYQIIGFGVLASLAAARFGLTGDDDDRFLEISGSWYGLTYKQKNALKDLGERPLSIGIGPRNNRTWIEYKTFAPLAAVLATVGNMSDKQRFKKEEWINESILGRLADGLSSGAFFFKDMAMIQGLADLVGASVSQQSDSEGFTKFISKAPASFASGFIPFKALLSDIDAWSDDKYYKPETGLDYWLSSVPFARRFAGTGPVVNALGEPISISRAPWARLVSFQKSDPVSVFLDDQAMKGNFVTVPDSPDVFDPKSQSKIDLKDLSKPLNYKYQVETGKALKSLLEAKSGAQGKALYEQIREMGPEEASRAMDQAVTLSKRIGKGKIQEIITPSKK